MRCRGFFSLAFLFEVVILASLVSCLPTNDYNDKNDAAVVVVEEIAKSLDNITNVQNDGTLLQQRRLTRQSDSSKISVNAYKAGLAMAAGRVAAYYGKKEKKTFFNLRLKINDQITCQVFEIKLITCVMFQFHQTMQNVFIFARGKLTYDHN